MSESSALLGPGTWVQHGPATLIVREAGWVVLIPGTRKEAIEAAWTVLGTGPTGEEFLDRLLEEAEIESIDKLAALLFGITDGTSATFGVKGKTPVAVYTDEGSQQIAGTDEEPFVLETVQGVHRTAFGDLPPEESIGAPRIETGIARVRGFVHMSVDPAELGDEARQALAQQVEDDGRSIEDPEVKSRQAAKPPPPAPPPASAPDASAPTPATSARSPRRPATADRRSGEMPSSVHRGPASAAGRPAADAPAAEAGPSVFDDLFDEKKTDPAETRSPTPQPSPAAAPSPASESARGDAPTAAPEDAPTPAPAPAAEPPPQPQRAPVPEPARAPASDAAMQSAPAAAAPPAPTSTAPVPTDAPDAEPASRAPGRRRLVSTSLFDRRRRPAPEEVGGGEPSDSAPTPPEQVPSAADEAPSPETDAGARAPGPAAEPAEQEPAPAPPTPVSSASPPVPPAPPTEAPSSGAPAPAGDPAPVEPPQPPAGPGPSSSASVPTPAPRDDESPTTLIAPIEEEVSPDTLIAPIDEGEGPPGTAEEPSTPLAVPPPADGSALSATSDLEPTGSYDDLFGQTIFRRIEDAAVRSAEDEEDHHQTEPPAAEHDDPADEAAPEPAEPQDQPAGQTPSVSSADASAAIGGDFIDWVPGVGRAAPEIAHTAARRAAPQQPAAAAPQDPAPAATQATEAGQPPAPRPGPALTPQPPSSPSLPPRQAAPGAAPQPGALDSGPAPQVQGQVPQAQPPRARHAGAPHPVPPAGPAPVHDAASNRGPAPDQVRPQDPPAGTTGAGPAPQPNRPVPGPGQAGNGVVTLPGLVCAEGHANPPERTGCRVCHNPLQGRTRTVARPPLGTVRVSTGASFVLDRTAIVGRRPSASRVSGNDVPQLITVPSSQQDISRSHVELRLEGWHVVALDLGTTNGTTLLRPGTGPVRLRTREGVVLTDGDQIDLGDGIQLLLQEAV